MTQLQVIPDIVSQRLGKYFKLERIDAILNRPNHLFEGKSALDYVRSGHTWEEVLTKYDVLFNYAVTK